MVCPTITGPAYDWSRGPIMAAAYGLGPVMAAINGPLGSSMVAITGPPALHLVRPIGGLDMVAVDCPGLAMAAANSPGTTCGCCSWSGIHTRLP